MVSQQVLRLRRIDKQVDPLLISVKSKGSGNLRNLKIVALDREEQHLFHGSIKDANAKSLQASSYNGTLTEWKAILSFALLCERPDGVLPDYLQDLETVAAINGEVATLTIRKSIGGITQKLGSLDLNQDDEREEIDIVEWADAAVSTSDDLRHRLEDMQASMASQQEQITKLTAQLDELVKAKKEHEDDLLGKFAALLNAKKLKIRDQQRLLSGAKVDSAAATSIVEARSRATASRRGKRKANVAAESHGSEYDKNESSVDEEVGEDQDSQQATPDPSDAETDDCDDATNEAVAASKPSRVKERNATDSDDMDVDAVVTRPRRELPFSRKATDKESAAPQGRDALDENGQDNGDDETDDDEL